MKLSKVRISQILAVDELEWKPGPFTRVTGANETGKTSVLEAIKAVCRGGHDATLLRRGAKKGEVVLAFEDGHTVKKTITEDRSSLRITDADGREIKRPAEFLGRLWDALAANPVDFVRGTDKQRIDWLLECVDRKAAWAALEEAAGADALRGIDQERTEPMGLIEHIRKTTYNERRDLNRDAKKAAEYAEALETDLPIDGNEVAEELKIEEAELQKLRDRLTLDIEKARSEARPAFAAIAEEKDRRQAEINAELEDLARKVDKLKQEQHALDMAAYRQSELLEQKLRLTIDQIKVRVNAEIEEMHGVLGELRERKAHADAGEERRRLAVKAREEAREAAAHSAQCSELLERIDALKRDLLASLPIEGVDVDPEANALTVNGTPFHRLNEATQWAIAIRLARHRAGEIGIICADGLELLDDANFESFRRMALDSGLEFIVTDRGSGALQVTTEGR